MIISRIQMSLTLNLNIHTNLRILQHSMIYSVINRGSQKKKTFQLPPKYIKNLI